MSLIGSLVQGIMTAAGNFFVEWLPPKLVEWRSKKSLSLKIEYPCDGQRIDLPKTRNDDGGFEYQVSGRLSRIDHSQELWLLTQNVVIGEVWPQSRDRVSLDNESGKWTAHAYLYPGTKKIRIIAVLAPSTAQQLFRYYFQVGEQFGWVSLSHVPEECWMQDWVEIEVPTD